MFVSAESGAGVAAETALLHEMRPDPCCSSIVKVDLCVSLSASERIRQKLYCLDIGLKESLLW